MADEEDEAIPNEGSLALFLALLMIYEGFFPFTPLPTHGKGRCKEKTKATKLLDIVCNLCACVCVYVVVGLIHVFVAWVP